MEARNSIYLIRHAQSLYNVVSAKVKSEGLEPFTFKFKEEYIDCGISPDGIEQAKQAGEILKDVNIRLVITSPFRRCLLTTHYIFQNHPNKPKVLVWPIVRERIESSCDIPSDIEELKKEFPLYDFSEVEKYKQPNFWLFETMTNQTMKSDLLSEMDQLFKTEEEKLKSYRLWLAKKMEMTYPALSEHGKDIFERTLMAKSALERVVQELKGDEKLALVSHSGFLIRFTSSAVDEKGAPVDGRYFKNCDIVEYNLTNHSIESERTLSS
jgi:Fructose-2,6-bisphosphatase